MVWIWILDQFPNMDITHKTTAGIFMKPVYISLTSKNECLHFVRDPDPICLQVSFIKTWCDSWTIKCYSYRDVELILILYSDQFQTRTNWNQSYSNVQINTN